MSAAIVTHYSTDPWELIDGEVFHVNPAAEVSPSVFGRATTREKAISNYRESLARHSERQLTYERQEKLLANPTSVEEVEL